MTTSTGGLLAASTGSRAFEAGPPRARRRVTARMLEGRGFVVIAAADGMEALAKARRHPGRIHVLLTDVVMPRMRGTELAERFLVDRPGTPVVYMSGYVEGPASDPLEEGKRALVQKPFASDDVVAALRRATSDLDASSPAEESTPGFTAP